MNEKEKIEYMRKCLWTNGISQLPFENALRIFHKRFPHSSKDNVISFFIDAMKIIESSALRQFKKRKKVICIQEFF